MEQINHVGVVSSIPAIEGAAQGYLTYPAAGNQSYNTVPYALPTQQFNYPVSQYAGNSYGAYYNINSSANYQQYNYTVKGQDSVKCTTYPDSTTINVPSAQNSVRNVNEENALPRQKILDGQEVDLKLTNRPLWESFNALTTEMIINKPGRRMFPAIECKVIGLKPNQKYNVFIDVELCDKNIWRFDQKWTPYGLASPDAVATDASRRIYLHPDSPNTGAFWMKNDISFHKLKLTNNKSSKKDQMLLATMHKYIPRVHIAPANDASNAMTFTFDVTKFIAVTAYQNTDVTQLKIDTNPFARGFRDAVEKCPEVAVPAPLKPKPTPTKPALNHHIPQPTVNFSCPSARLSLSPTIPAVSASFVGPKTPTHGNATPSTIPGQNQATSTPKIFNSDAYVDQFYYYNQPYSSYQPSLCNSYQLSPTTAYSYEPAPVRSGKRAYDSIGGYETSDVDTVGQSAKYPCLEQNACQSVWTNYADSGYDSSIYSSAYQYSNDYSSVENSAYNFSTAYAQIPAHGINSQNSF